MASSNSRSLFAESIELFRDNNQDGDRDASTQILESDEQLESGIDADATSPNNKNKKPKRANVNWSMKASAAITDRRFQRLQGLRCSASR